MGGSVTTSFICKMHSNPTLPFVIVLLANVCFSKPPDWLVHEIQDEVTLSTPDASHLILSNGLITREFLLSPNFGTVDFRSESTGRSILRTIATEANITLDGIQYNIGGLSTTSSTHVYLNRSSLVITADPNAFQYIRYSQSKPLAPFHWEPGLRFSPMTANWPPKGLHLQVDFKAPANVRIPQHADITVSMHYEMYQGLPIMAKWMTVSIDNNTKSPVEINSVIVEYLPVQKPYAPWNYGFLSKPWELGSGMTGSWLYVETDQAHGTVIDFIDDPLLSAGASEPILRCTYYSSGPGVILGNGTYKTMTEFESFRVIELVTDTNDRERVGLSRHRLTRLLNPQTQENPIFFHATNSTSSGFKQGIDQMVEVGFEMYIYSFGSGFSLESTSSEYLKEIKENIEYAKSKGIEVGGYDLICLERGHGGYGHDVGSQWDAVDPATNKLTTNACFASGWYDKLRGIIMNFINQTGLSMLETDGPYGGGPCGSTDHDHHIGADDSIYWQTRLQGEMYKELKNMNIFINQPDFYFYQGGNKVGMGYNENQYSLPRWEDLTVSRQSMYDDTYHLLPTQGWMFVPIVVYHAGGSAAMFEPLESHLLEYEWALAQYMGYGVAACYRGNVLYDGPKSQAIVKKWVSFFKQYRDILISDIVHVRRPDMQDIDVILHVNPFIENRGLAMVFNPTSYTLTRNLSLPLYYTGLDTSAIVFHEGQQPGQAYNLQRDYSVSISFTMMPETITWFLIKAP